MSQTHFQNFNSRRSRRQFSWMVFGVGIFCILVWHLCQPETWSLLQSWTDGSRTAPEWLNRQEDISRTDRLLTGLTPEMLEIVKDRAPVKADETRTVMKIWNQLNAMKVEEIEKASLGRVLFAQYYKQPGAYRGCVVRVKGNIRLVQKMEVPNFLRKNPASAILDEAQENPAVPEKTEALPAPKEPEQVSEAVGTEVPAAETPVNSETAETPETETPVKSETAEAPETETPVNSESSVEDEDADFGYDFSEYYELWIQTDDNPSEPVLVNTLELPAELPIGEPVNIPVVIDGVFFKLYLYEGMEEMLYAPCFYAKSPIWMLDVKLPVSRNGSENDSENGAAADQEKKPFQLPFIYAVGLALALAGILLLAVNRRTQVPEPKEPLPEKLELPENWNQSEKQ